MLKKRIVMGALAGAAAFAMPVGGAIALTSTPAAAVTLTYIKCSAITGTTTTTVTATGCTGNTGGASKPLSPVTLALGGKVKWSNGLYTKITAPTITTGTLCPAGDTDAFSKAKVSADTTHSASVGGTVKGEFCIDGSGNISLAPGTKLKI